MKIEILLGRLFISVICFVLIFIFIDFLSRYFVTGRSPIELKFPVQIYRYPEPFTMFGGKPNSNYEGINNHGYKGKFPSITKSSNEFRVIMLGGSTVVRGTPPISQLLERKFTANNMSQVKVYNFGVVSSVSNMEIARIVFEISKLHPDLIIFYNGGNDIFSPWTYDPRPGYPLNFIAYENNPLLESDVKKYPSIAMFAYGSNILRHFFPSYFLNYFIPLEDVREEVGWKTVAWRDEITEIYVNNIVKADTLSKAFGAEFIAFFQPLIYFKSHLTDKERKLINEENKNYAIDMRRRILAKIEKTKKNHSVIIVDLSLVYKEVIDEVFGDDIHTKQSAKPLIAEQMFEHIMSNDLIRRNDVP
jgi:lysophospholipase L1-like esterase